MSYATEREERAAGAAAWLQQASPREISEVVQGLAYDMVRRGATPEAAQHLYEASTSLRAAARAAEGAETRRTYCMFCRGVTLGQPPLDDCKWPFAHLDESMEPYVAEPALNRVGAAMTFADRYAGTPWFAGCDYDRDPGGVSLIVNHWVGAEPPAEVRAPWHGFPVEFKAVERRGF